MQAYIVRTPSEGLMGLDREGNPIVLHNGDMISEEVLHKDYLKLLKDNMMVRPVKMVDNLKDIANIRQTETRAQKEARRIERKRTKRGYQYNITNWVNVNRKLRFREV